MTESKKTDLVAAVAVALPVLGIPGLPANLISLQVNVHAKDFVTLTCEFYPEQKTYDALQDAWAPVLAQYKLVRIDDPTVTLKA